MVKIKTMMRFRFVLYFIGNFENLFEHIVRSMIWALKVEVKRFCCLKKKRFYFYYHFIIIIGKKNIYVVMALVLVMRQFDTFMIYYLKKMHQNKWNFAFLISISWWYTYLKVSYCGHFMNLLWQNILAYYDLLMRTINYYF